jgi:hypothetical protein
MAASEQQGQQRDDGKQNRSSLETGHLDPAIGGGSAGKFFSRGDVSKLTQREELPMYFRNSSLARLEPRGRLSSPRNAFRISQMSAPRE